MSKTMQRLLPATLIFLFFYGVLQFDATGRYLLGMRAYFQIGFILDHPPTRRLSPQ